VTLLLTRNRRWTAFFPPLIPALSPSIPTLQMFDTRDLLIC